MTFAIKPIRYEDLDQIYAHDDEQISKFTYKKRSWPQDMHGKNWAIDESMCTFLLWLPWTRDDTTNRYLFGTRDGVALLREERYCLFSFMYVSPVLVNRMNEVQSLIREAFKVAGEIFDGTTDENDPSAVPNAQFTSN